MNFRGIVLGVLVGLSSSLTAQKITEEDKVIALGLLKACNLPDKDIFFFVESVMDKLVGQKRTRLQIKQCVAQVCNEMRQS